MTSIIILAAGNGSRLNLGYNKMLYKFNEKPLYQICIEKFKKLGYKDIYLVINESDASKISADVNVVIGGKTRGESVYNGLKQIKGDYVIIHDGARPFISLETIEEVEKSFKEYKAIVVAHKITDTIKEVGDKLKTLNRERLIAAETPQAGDTSLLRKCYECAIKDNYIGTDDMSLVEKYSNEKIGIILSDGFNIKITTKFDLQYGEFLLERGLVK